MLNWLALSFMAKHLQCASCKLYANPAVVCLLQPHLGTDRLIGILRAFRAQLLTLGVRIQWGTAVRSLDITASGSIAGVHLEGGSSRSCSQDFRVVQACTR